MSGALGNFGDSIREGLGGEDAILGIMDALNQDKGPQTFGRGLNVVASQLIKNRLYNNLLKQIPFGAPQQTPQPQSQNPYDPQILSPPIPGGDPAVVRSPDGTVTRNGQPPSGFTGGQNNQPYWQTNPSQQQSSVPFGAPRVAAQNQTQNQPRSFGSGLSQQTPGFNIDLLRKLPPQIGMPILQDLFTQQFAPKPHTFAATRDGQIYDTATGQMVGQSVKSQEDAKAAAERKQIAEGIGGTIATGNIGTIDSLPIDAGQREALRQLILSGDPKAMDTYREILKSLSERKDSGITTRNVEVGGETKVGQFKDGNLIGFAKDPSGKEITAPRFSSQVTVNLPQNDAEVQSYVQNILQGNMNMQNVPIAKRGAVSKAMAALGKDEFSPRAGTQYTLEATRISQPYKKLPQYELTANGLPYLQRIQAALQVPGSVSDQDLLDSLTKLNTAGNAITDAQVKLITDGRSFADSMNVFFNRLNNGGVLSPNQRQQIADISQKIYDNYRKGYQPVYDEAASKLKQAGIPEQFWGLPDLNKLGIASGVVDQGGGGPTRIQGDADYNKLPSGASFIGPDGVLRKKP